MSHLTILPTVITDLELLEETLLAEHYLVQRPGLIKAFGQDVFPAELVATDSSGLQMGWRWDADGSLALMLDLGQTRNSAGHKTHLKTILRAYALRSALRSADGVSLDPSVSTTGQQGAERAMC
ncbi:MAG: DUF1257 domain-containing protein [Synechococcus sp. cluster3_bin.96]|nr:DUF1257 domain-containing protein [Synechococcus sp. cluster3_bin.96]|tara:strand:+ start:533 stop:904 length:372 start_codon:yes stop_codon:yes gene_type:complete